MVNKETGASVSDGQKLLLWSVNTYAAGNIKHCFDNPYSAAISGSDFDMDGLSYYPINWDSTVSIGDMPNIKFYNSEIETRENYTKTNNSAYDNHLRVTSGTDQSHTQHYMMHCSLFRNVNADMTIGGDLSFAGNIGKVNGGSGSLFCGTMTGNTDARTVFTNAGHTIELRGIYINSTSAEWNNSDSDDYAPLLINKIGEYSNFTLTGVSTPLDIENEKYYYNTTDGNDQAATSLVGDAGDSNITLSFSGIKLDSRTLTYDSDISDAVIVGYLSDCSDAYNTDYSIFTKATLLNKFFYNATGNCSGSYNYTWNEDWGTGGRNVTYGKEISDTLEYLDENDESEEKWYLGSTIFTDPTDDENTSSGFSFSSGFLPYVATAYEENVTHELSVNLASASIEKGCGTYNDPYIISTGKQFETIANLIQNNMPSDGFVINYPSSSARASGWCTATTSGETTTYDHITYTYLNDYEGFYSNAKNHSGKLETAVLREYLCGAYYMIDDDLILSSSFHGLGSMEGTTIKQYAFRGIIVGKGKDTIVNGNTVTTYPSITNMSSSPFINISNGSVIKNVGVNVKGLNLEIYEGSTFSFGYDTLHSYGAVIGQIMGGDNVIDNVEVSFEDSTINLSIENGSKNQLFPVGGYVGVIVNGDLFFRHMSGDIDGLGIDSTIVTDGTNNDLVSSTNMKWLYVNPIIGRVINGYAATETTKYRPFEDGTRTYADGSMAFWNDSSFVTLDISDEEFNTKKNAYTEAAKGVTMRNSTKNYSIVDIVKPSNDSTKLDVSAYTSVTQGSCLKTTITFPDAQSMQILSMLTQSNCTNAYYGSGTSLDSKYSYQSRYSICSYGNNEYKTTRMADYSNVGPVSETGISSSDPDFLESRLDTYVVGSTDNAAGATASENLVPYLVKNYTTKKGNKHSGYAVFNVSCHATLVNLVFGTSGKETWYLPDGYRGIGCLSLGVATSAKDYSDMCISAYGFAGNNKEFSLNMSYNYYPKTFENYNINAASNNSNYGGFGLFNDINSNITGRRRDNNGSCTIDGTNYYAINGCSITGNVNSIVYNNTDGTEFAIGNTTNANGYNAVGAFAGQTNYRDPNKIIFENIQLNNIDVRGTRYAGGLIGFANQTGQITGGSVVANYSEIVINNVSADGLRVASGYYTGGLIGWTNSKVTINGDTGNTGDNSEIRIIKVDSVYNANSNGIYTGGLIGYVSTANNITWQTSIKNVDITGLDGNKAQIGVITNTSRATNNSLEQSVGGMIGYVTNSRVLIDNCNVKGADIIGGFTGGYVGRLYRAGGNTNPHLITNCKLASDSLTVKVQGTKCAGGLFGRMESASSGDNNSCNLTVDTFTVDEYVIININSTTTGESYRNAGGIGGEIRQDSTSQAKVNLRNIKILNSTIETKYKAEADGRQGTGLLLGTLYPNQTSATYGFVYGYNILLDRDTLARYTTSSFKNASANTLIGNNFNAMPVKLVGVSIQGGTIPTTRLVGKYKQNNTTEFLGANGYVILADYNGDSVTTTSSSTNKEFAFAGNSKNVKDYNGDTVTNNYPYVTSSGYQMIDGTNFLTGDGEVFDLDSTEDIEWTEGNEEKTVTVYESAFASICKDIIAGTKTTRYKRTLSDSQVETWLENYGDKITTYNTAMGLTESDAALDVDFPVLLADDSSPSKLTAMINGYLQIVTDSPSNENFAQYNTNKNSEKNYKVKISTIRRDGTLFEEVTDGTPALYTTNNQYFTFSNNNVDSSGSNARFSLIDVQYYDPSSSNDEVVAYHVYVPVLVKKMLKYEFKASVLSGTEYRSDDYEDKYKIALVDSFGSPITVYATWIIEDSEIQSLLDSGDSLLWNYEKTASLTYAAINNETAYLPSGTTLVLVDPNNNRDSVYYGNLASGASSIDFNNLYADYYTESDPSVSFSPQTLAELGEFTVTEYDSSTSTNRYIKSGTEYYKEGVNYTFNITDECTELVGTDGTRDSDDSHPGTIKIGDDYYRPYDSAIDQNPDDDDESGYDTYYISVNGDINENYYINIFTPESSSFAHVTLSSPNQLVGNVLSQRSKATPAHFYLGDIYTQSLTFHTGTSGETSDQIMNEDNTSISVFAKSEIEFNDLYRSYVTDVLAANDEIDLYHSFIIYLTSIPANKREIAGNPTISGTYTFESLSSDPDSQPLSGVASSQSFAEIKPTLVRSIKNDLLYNDPVGRASDEENEQRANVNGKGKATITAQFTMRYDVSGIIAQFPEGDGSGDSGVEVSMKSNLAYTYTNTAYSSITESTDDAYNKIYYRLAMDEATLKYNVPSSTKSNRLDGSVSQLGINAFNAEKLGTDTTPDIDTVGYYTIYNLPDLADADKVRWTLEVRSKQKIEDGVAQYGETLPIYEYLDPTAGITMKAVGNGSESVVTYGTVIDSEGNHKRRNQLEQNEIYGLVFDDNFSDYYYDGMGIQVKLKYGVITNTVDFTSSGNKNYANYEVILKVWLYDSKGDLIDGSYAHDHIIYTNAKVNPNFIDTN